jgi:hypothetical protein
VLRWRGWTLSQIKAALPWGFMSRIACAVFIVDPVAPRRLVLFIRARRNRGLRIVQSAIERMPGEVRIDSARSWLCSSVPVFARRTMRWILPVK